LQAKDRDDLVKTMSAVMENRRSKAAAVAALAISRPSLYERIARIERILGCHLGKAGPGPHFTSR
jgi:DNA-binding transcriptional LysR family regulator